MLATQLSQNAESARAAALQAEFNEKRWVWVPDEKEGYLSGWVHKEEDDIGEIVMSAGGEIRRVPLYALSKMNPPKFDRVEDIADLTFLNEASVVHNLRLRYGSGAIYTYSGLFLVSINPYQSLPLYSESIVQQYRNKRRDENPPHIFAVAERAWVNMGEERENQSILITGESGAGKTESTKKVIQYLAAIASDAHAPSTSSHSRSTSLASSPSYNSFMPAGLPRSSSYKNKGHAITPSLSGSSHLTAKGRLGLLERQILQANPILEAFGNAQTQRNNNSSRFGKFVRITFAPDGSIAGANIDWYLLEKSRVVFRSDAERSFHVFYQLMTGDRTLKGTLLLEGGIEDYEYLNKSRREIDGIDDRAEWFALKDALDIVGFTEAEQLDLFRIVAAILHIGNINITSTRSDNAFITDSSKAERACYLLGIPISEFTKALLRPRVLAGREWVSQARTKQQALDELSALCKTLYEKSFNLLVDRINRALDRPSSKSTFIGVLDIAGFEIFETNAYEQLLINYTNEKLQQFFNHHMFVLEQEEYSREGIEWDYVNFGLDLQPTIDLLEANGNAIGILSCLDEECIMPKATDLTFTNKLHSLWGGEPLANEEVHPGRDKYEPSRFEQGFIVQHYAGKVEYRTDGWLEKNKDPLNDNLTRVLAASSERYVASLFSDYNEVPLTMNDGTAGLASGKKRTIKKGAFRTVAQRHKEQLSSLMAQLQATQPHFVRCIVPNANKRPGRVDVPLVLDQLRCNGVLEGIRIARLGYPNRLPFVEFRQRYEVLTPGIIPRGYMDGRKACLRIVEALELDHSIFKVGTSKIFFKAGVLADLEERRDALLFDIISKLQAMARMWTARRQMNKILNRAIAVRIIQRNARVYGELRQWPWWQLYTKVRPLLAATRNDDELRRKEAELALIKERAERDKQERDSLENLKMSLETQMRKIEEDLKAERALALDKDDSLERSKRRESELEDEIVALQADIDSLDSQLDRTLKMKKAIEEKHDSLRAAFDEAAGHLVRLESEQHTWRLRETELTMQIEESNKDIEELRRHRDELQQLSDELKTLASQLEEDLLRAKERTDVATSDLETRLGNELRNRDLLKNKADKSEQDARQAREQLAEMARAATDYSNIIQMKEKEIARLVSNLRLSKEEGERSLKHIVELQGDIDTLSAELTAQTGDRERSEFVRAKLQEELDELRTLMEAKTSEESRRNEVEKSKDEELAELRRQVLILQQELGEARRLALDGQNKLKVDLDNTLREQRSLQQSHASLLTRERTSHSQLAQAQATLSELEKTKRALESEVHSLRSRQHDCESQLADAQKAKEGLERHLAAAQARYQDFEDVVLQLEREKDNHYRQLETTRKELESELKKRTQLERMVSTQKTELVKYKDSIVKLELELDKALSNLKAREWDIKQLEGRQDKTIVEHVHVLEEAKRVTDRQLAAAQAELLKNATYIRSLEKAKSRLAGEVEDLARQTQQDHMKSRTKQKTGKVQEPEILSSSAQSELRTALEAYKAKAENFKSHLDAAEIASAKAARSEALIRRSLTDAENSQAELTAEKAALEAQLRTAGQKLRDMAARLDDEGRESASIDILQKRLAEELEDEREQHLKDLAERDFAVDQTRKKYQAELAQLSEELQSQRDSMSRLREDNRKIRSDYDELQLRYDDEVYNSGSWKKERERLETKIADINSAYEAATGAQAEQQAQIVSLHSQVRELRGVLNDTETDRALLQKARRALQAELEAIKLNHVDAHKMSSDREFQKLQLRKQDLERSLEEQEDRVAMAFDRMKKAEYFANESQVELGKVRVENSELDRKNANLDRQIKELNVRIVDLETRSYTNPSRPATISRRSETRIEELTNQLNPGNKEKSVGRSALRDAKFQSAELERQRARMEEEKKLYESQISALRQAMDAMQTEASEVRAAGRRSERDAADYRQKVLNLQQELERLRNRLERPALDRPSSTNSPRK